MVVMSDIHWYGAILANAEWNLWEDRKMQLDTFVESNQ